MTLLQKIEALHEALNHIQLHTTDPRWSGYPHMLTLFCDGDDVDLSLDLGEPLGWSDRWQIIGCLIEDAFSRGDLQGRDEIIEASKVGIHEVLDVRLRQLETLRAR